MIQTVIKACIRIEEMQDQPNRLRLAEDQQMLLREAERIWSVKLDLREDLLALFRVNP